MLGVGRLTNVRSHVVSKQPKAVSQLNTGTPKRCESFYVLGGRFYCVAGGLCVTVSGLNAWVERRTEGSAVTRHGTRSTTESWQMHDSFIETPNIIVFVLQ